MQSNISIRADDPKTTAQWLAIKPSKKLWNHLEQIRVIVDSKFNGISNWRLSTSVHSHITLYMGIESVLNKEQQIELMSRIDDATKNIDVFTKSISPNDIEIKLLGKFLSLHFTNTGQLSALQTKVKEVTKQFIIDHNLQRNDNWFDRPIFDPHITLGTIDLPATAATKGPDRDPTITEFAKKGNKPWLTNLNQRIHNGEFGNEFKMDVKSVDLIGVNKTTSSLPQKIYYTLASVALKEAEVSPIILSKIRCRAIMRKTLLDICGSQQSGDIKTGTYKDMNGIELPCINVSFANKADAAKVLTKANKGNKIFINSDGTFMIRLGIGRMEALFGKDLGAQILDGLTL